MQFVYRKTDNTKFFIIFKGKRQIAKAFEETSYAHKDKEVLHIKLIKNFPKKAKEWRCIMVLSL